MHSLGNWTSSLLQRNGSSRLTNHMVGLIFLSSLGRRAILGTLGSWTPTSRSHFPQLLTAEGLYQVGGSSRAMMLLFSYPQLLIPSNDPVWQLVSRTVPSFCRALCCKTVALLGSAASVTSNILQLPGAEKLLLINSAASEHGRSHSPIFCPYWAVPTPLLPNCSFP